jgi:HlyD family secretion protein
VKLLGRKSLAPKPRKRRQFNPRLSIALHLFVGLLLVGGLVFGIGSWAATTELSGAVIASGQLVVESDVKKVQHPTGGVVAELLVREGDHVNAGDVLVRLDDTQTRANLGVITTSLDELVARLARDEAERDDAPSVTFPAELLARISDPAVARLIEGERRFFDVTENSRKGQKAQLRERVSQLSQQINGLGEQISSKKREIDLIHQQLVGVSELWKKNLIQIDKLIALQRDVAHTEGELGQLQASVAEAKEKIAETELQVLQVDRTLQTDVSKDLAEARGKISELRERKIAAEDQLKRVLIRSPQTGVVQQLSVHTVGGVIGATGEPIALVVPEADDLRVEAKIQPNDIDQVHLGQIAVLRFSTFNSRTTPEIKGEVSLISPDVSQDPKTGASFYTIRIKPSQEEIARLGDAKLVPGMPVEAFIQTSPRTVMSYLIKPLHDQIARAFREK